MKCLLKRKSCKPSWQQRLPCGSWYCAGVKQRRSPHGASQDVISLCMNTYFIKAERVLELTPDEATKLAAGLAAASGEWLEKNGAYQDFIEEQDAKNKC